MAVRYVNMLTSLGFRAKNATPHLLPTCRVAGTEAVRTDANGSHWLREELGRHQRATRQRESRVCQRCDSGAKWTTSGHMRMFEREQLWRLVNSMPISLGTRQEIWKLSAQPLIRLAPFVLQCFETCAAMTGYFCRLILIDRRHQRFAKRKRPECVGQSVLLKVC